jgi:hypothetical protein
MTGLMLNPGSQGGAAAAAFAGRVVGGLPGLFWAYAVAQNQPEGQVKVGMGPSLLRFVGQVSGAAGAAALAAPQPLRTRAAVGAAIGGMIPILGAPLAALGAYIATSPKRAKNPSPMATAGLVALGLAAAGGLGYGGYRAYKAYQEKKSLPPANGGNGGGNVDEWGADLDTNEQWGAGPVTGQDGKDYAYVIYHNTADNTYWYMYKGANNESGSAGPFATADEAVWCVENRLPMPCVGQS